MPRYFPSICILAALLGLSAGDGEAQSLRGSRASVDRMYRHAVGAGLHFYQTPRGVRRAADRGTFVRLSGNADYRVAGASFPYVKPTTRTFVHRLAAQYRARCGEKLVVTSAVRPTSRQPRNSVGKSVHPTGIAVDLRRPRKASCLSWLRRTLLHLEGTGVVEATEERRPPHFHVAVYPAPYRRYVQGRGGEVPKGEARPETVRYTVRPGDSLWVIARRHGTSVARLKAVNGLRSSKLVVGQKIVVPRG